MTRAKSRPRRAAHTDAGELHGTIAHWSAEAEKMKATPPSPMPEKTAAGMSLSANQLEAVRKMNAANKQLWRDDADQLAALAKEHSGTHAHRLMKTARKIVDQHTLKTGSHNYGAAVAASKLVDEQRGQDFLDARKSANDKRAAEADAEALKNYDAWKRSLAHVLKGKTTAQCVALYIKTKRLGRYERARIRAMGKAGKI